jgi:hypothetical protein
MKKAKAKISGVSKIYDTNIHVKIKIDKNTQKKYNQFRQKLIDKYKIGVKGSSGFTKLTGKGIDINVFKNKDYLHLVIYGRLRKTIFNMIFDYFEYSEPR